MNVKMNQFFSKHYFQGAKRERRKGKTGSCKTTRTGKIETRRAGQTARSGELCKEPL